MYNGNITRHSNATDVFLPRDPSPYEPIVQPIFFTLARAQGPQEVGRDTRPRRQFTRRGRVVVAT